MTSHRWERGTFSAICKDLDYSFVHDARRIPAGRWQALDISDKPEMTPIELMDCTVGLSIPETQTELQELVEPNLPWAEDHFQERISGQPLNPPPSHEWWPFNRNKNETFRKDEKFSHTYPERFWPKFANVGGKTDKGRQIFVPHVGIRYEYGDLRDVVDLLSRDAFTRQAYLPVWFPEDTGAVHGERVPCSLGYQFFIRPAHKATALNLHCIYTIRSCDYMRHFRDDVYLAARLTQWVVRHVDVSQIGLLRPGRLTMHIGSFHVFSGDVPLLQARCQLEDEGSYGYI